MLGRDGRTDERQGLVTRRQWLVRMGILAGGGLLAACTPAPAASPTVAPAPKPTEAPKPAAPAAPPAATKPAEAAKPAEAPKPAEAAKPAATTAPAAAKRGGKITWAIDQDPVNLIPFGAVPTANQWGKEFMYDSLLEWDRDLAVKPALAESFETPDDKTYVFKLRRGVKFHDGKEVDAEDVKYSFGLQEKPPPPGSTSQFYPKIASIEAPDKYTVKMNMSRPDPTMPGYLAWSRYSPIVPNGLYDKVNVLTTGIGTGPFKLVEYVSNDRVVYTRNPDFWKPGFPYIDELILKVMPDEQARIAALRSGAIDGTTVSPDGTKTVANDRSLSVLRGLVSSHKETQLSMKGEKKPWHDKRVRQAISAAVNRQIIIDNVYGGDAEVTAEIPPGYGDWPITPAELKEKYFKQDVEKAKRLMAEAGFGDGFKVELQAIATREYTQIAEIMKEQLAAIKIDVTVQPLEIGTFAKNNADGNFEWHQTGRGMRGDVSHFMAEFHPTSNQFKAWFGEGWKNDELIKLVDDGLATVDQAKRKQIYRRMQEILLDENPHITLVQPYKYHVIRNRVKDMYVSYTDFHTGLREVWADG